MLIGALGGGVIADRLGRRPAFQLMAAFVGGGSILSACSPTLSSLTMSRLCVGIGLGAAPAALSLYAEFLPPVARGASVMAFFAFFSVSF